MIIMEAIRWISIVMLWIVTGCMVVLTVRTRRIQSELENQVRIWKARNEYEKENSNETNAL